MRIFLKKPTVDMHLPRTNNPLWLKTLTLLVLCCCLWLPTLGQQASQTSEAFAKGHVLAQQRLYLEAANQLSKLPDQNIYLLQHQKADWLLKANKPLLARKAYAKAIRLKPQAISPRLGMAKCAANIGSVVEAISLHKKILSMQPNEPESMLSLVQLLVTQRQFEEALPIAKQYCTLYPSVPEGLYAYAQCLHARGQVLPAIETAKQALWLKPNYADAENDLLKWLQPPE